MTDRRHRRVRGASPLRVGLVGLGALLLLAAGCLSKPPTAVPEAVQEAERLSMQALRLQAAGQWQAGAQWWSRAAQQFQVLNQTTNLTLAWHNQALCLAELGKTGEARDLLSRALRLNQHLGRTEDAWRQEVALLQWSEPGDTGPRLRALLTRADAGSRPQDAYLAAVLDFEIARARWRLGDALAAAAGLPELEERFRVLGDPAAAATTSVLQARLWEALGRKAEAIAAWRKSLADFEALAQPRGIAVALDGLGRVLAADDATREESRRLLERADANFRLLGLRPDTGSP